MQATRLDFAPAGGRNALGVVRGGTGRGGWHRRPGRGRRSRLSAARAAHPGRPIKWRGIGEVDRPRQGGRDVGNREGRPPAGLASLGRLGSGGRSFAKFNRRLDRLGRIDQGLGRIDSSPFPTLSECEYPVPRDHRPARRPLRNPNSAFPIRQDGFLRLCPAFSSSSRYSFHRASWFFPRL